MTNWDIRLVMIPIGRSKRICATWRSKRLRHCLRRYLRLLLWQRAHDRLPVLAPRVGIPHWVRGRRRLPLRHYLFKSVNSRRVRLIER